MDRYLDDEGDPAERARRDSDAAARPELRERLDRRQAFLETLRSARWAPGPSSTVDLRRLQERVRGALAGEALRAARARWRPVLVGMAAAVVGLGAWLLSGRDRGAEALDPVSMAAQVLDWQPGAFTTCAQGAGAGDVHRFGPVLEGELVVSGCASETQQPGTSVARLRHPEELPVVGYVAVPASGNVAANEVGITEVEAGRVVVFDVLDHGRRVYLAVNPAALKAKHTAGERWMCAACHGPARQTLPNPHRIVLRRAP